MLSEEEKQAIEYAKSLIELFDSGVPLNYLEQENDNLKLFLNLITKLQKENEEKDRQIKALVKYIDSNNCVTSNSCDFQDDFKIEKCIDEGNCKDCIRKYFEGQTKN